ncbi:hypothetical protein EYF80_031734 [Liparis tanakae]|uniref:Uncharacterized protein n=1 Tax=Liparis tanakae TaxID=230148 RepID=A0A4Z2GZI6_9TELE|nr:hypothetical protein EYF80_031734 [Liparis tanakae]
MVEGKPEPPAGQEATLANAIKTTWSNTGQKKGSSHYGSDQKAPTKKREPKAAASAALSVNGDHAAAIAPTGSAVGITPFECDGKIHRARVQSDKADSLNTP